MFVVKSNVGITCDTASVQQVTQMNEKAQKLIHEHSTVQRSTSEFRKYRGANVEDKMWSCQTLLLNKVEELEFEQHIKFQDQGLGQAERITPERHNMTLEEWLQRTVTHTVRATMAVEDKNILCKSHSTV